MLRILTLAALAACVPRLEPPPAMIDNGSSFIAVGQQGGAYSVHASNVLDGRFDFPTIEVADQDVHVSFYDCSIEELGTPLDRVTTEAPSHGHRAPTAGCKLARRAENVDTVSPEAKCGLGWEPSTAVPVDLGVGHSCPKYAERWTASLAVDTKSLWAVEASNGLWVGSSSGAVYNVTDEPDPPIAPEPLQAIAVTWVAGQFFALVQGPTEVELMGGDSLESLADRGVKFETPPSGSTRYRIAARPLSGDSFQIAVASPNETSVVTCSGATCTRNMDEPTLCPEKACDPNDDCDVLLAVGNDGFYAATTGASCITHVGRMPVTVGGSIRGLAQAENFGGLVVSLSSGDLVLPSSGVSLWPIEPRISGRLTVAMASILIAGANWGELFHESIQGAGPLCEPITLNGSPIPPTDGPFLVVSKRPQGVLVLGTSGKVTFYEETQRLNACSD